MNATEALSRNGEGLGAGSFANDALTFTESG